MEYDVLIQGKQTSHFEDEKTIAGDSTGYNSSENDQQEGYGLRGSIKVMKEINRVGFFVEPFVRYWDIETSDVDIITSSTGYPSYYTWEPSNTTKEIGVRAGLHF